MILTRTKPPITHPGRFAYLMGLYAENYLRLERLFAPSTLTEGRYLSSVDDGLDVRLEVLGRHPYTLELILSYCFADQESGLPVPSACLRSYADAKLAEAVHCRPGRQLCDLLGPFPAAQTVLEHRLRMNVFLDKWLEYLAEQGHSRFTLCHEASKLPLATV